MSEVSQIETGVPVLETVVENVPVNNGIEAATETRATSEETDGSGNPDWQPLSVMLNLLLHNRLAGHNKLSLDSVVPDNTISFLLSGDRYCHPEDTELFPVEIIQSSLSECGAPLFSHRYGPREKPSGKNYRILTTNVGTWSGRAITFGLFGPEELIDSTTTEWQFSETVASLRSAAIAAHHLNSDVRLDLEPDIPTCLVDRFTECIVVANQSFARQLDAEVTDLPGIRYSDLVADHPGRLTDTRVNLQTVDTNEYQLVLVRWSSNTETARDSGAADDTQNHEELSPHFFHKFSNKLSGITTAASYLKAHGQNCSNPDESALLSVILDETSDLGRELERFRLVTEYDELPVENISIMDELCRALDSDRPEVGAGWQVHRIPALQAPTVPAPEGALRSVFEAIVSIHAPTENHGAVTLENSADTNSTLVSFVSPVCATSQRSFQHLRAYITALCRHMNIELTEIGRRQGSRMRTTLILPSDTIKSEVM